MNKFKLIPSDLHLKIDLYSIHTADSLPKWSQLLPKAEMQLIRLSRTKSWKLKYFVRDIFARNLEMGSKKCPQNVPLATSIVFLSWRSLGGDSLILLAKHLQQKDALVKISNHLKLRMLSVQRLTPSKMDSFLDLKSSSSTWTLYDKNVAEVE